MQRPPHRIALRGPASALLAALAAACVADEGERGEPEPAIAAAEEPARPAADAGAPAPAAAEPAAPGAPPAGGEPTASPPLSSQPLSSQEERAVEAIRAGRHAEAREILGEILVAHHLQEARRLLDEGRPEDALLDVDAALAIQPRNAEVKLLQGRGQLALAEKGIAAGQPGAFVEGALLDALAAFRASGERVEALTGGSRAALLLGRTDEALALARRAVEARRAQGGAPGEAELGPWARAAYQAYAEAQGAGQPAAETEPLYAEAEDALGALVGRTPEDPWVWRTLSYLQEWAGRGDDARATVERGLDRSPDDASLLARLDELARRAGGPARAAEALGAFRERHPSIPAGWFLEARALFEAALARFGAGDFDPEPFRVAEGRFARARELDPMRYHDDATTWEIVCRDAVGWCLYRTGDLAGARAAFLSMNELLPNGIAWDYRDPTGGTELPSGLVGLEFVGAGHYERGEWLPAAEVNARLHELVPEEPKFANNAGLFYRDAAVELETEARILCRAARGLVDDRAALAQLLETAGVDPALADTPEARRALARAANERLERARALMQRSRVAYEDAARLAPDDVRIVNDAALVLVYYVHEDLDRAEEMLRRAVALGEEQLADETLAEDARWELQNAWGDAHQNLGVLYAAFRDDRAEAARWFERAIEIGPEPRSPVEEYWLPYARGELQASEHDELAAVRGWAEPCALGRDGGDEEDS